jgi:hypothetical protein
VRRRAATSPAHFGAQNDTGKVRVAFEILLISRNVTAQFSLVRRNFPRRRLRLEEELLLERVQVIDEDDLVELQLLRNSAPE